jgi:predicted phage terminase large subunit-like protein
VPVREEQEPGSSGKAVVAARTRRMAGFDYRGAPPAGDKVTRARPLCAQAEAGNVLVYAGPEADLALRERARELVDEFAAFPLGATKDQVDASAGAFNTLTAEDAGELELLFGAGTGTAPATAALDAELAALEARLGGARPA